MLTIDFKRCLLKKNFSLLDIGCGEARHIYGALQFEDVYCTGVDLDEKSLGIAKKRGADFSIKKEYLPTFVKGDATQLPFEDQSFDTIICSEVLEHIHDFKQVIQEIKRLCKPTSRVAISVPRYYPEKICWLLSEKYHQTPGGHVRIFNPNHLKKAFIDEGFRLNFQHFAHAMHAPYWWLRCLFWDKQESMKLIQWYERWLVKQLFKYPVRVSPTESFLNPLLGKSIVMYFQLN